jgi:hypothetical protein
LEGLRLKEESSSRKRRKDSYFAGGEERESDLEDLEGGRELVFNDQWGDMNNCDFVEILREGLELDESIERLEGSLQTGM